MPFTFNRDKQKPSDKLGGDDFLSGIRKQFDQDRKMFFDKNPAWESSPSSSGFSRGGFFDDPPGRGLGIRSHLDDLASRHPEFASSLRRGPAWAEPADGHSQWDPRGAEQADGHSQWEAGTTGPPMDGGTETEVPMETDAGRVDAADERRDEAGPLRGRTRLAATATDVPTQGEEPEGGGRGQRSWSAPPDSRAPPPGRFVSRLDFQPAQPAQHPAQPGTQPHQQQQQQHQQHQQQQQPQSSEPGPKHGNVRHIPIFVEGRDEPVVARQPSGPHQEQLPRQPAQHQEPAPRQPAPHQEPARSFNASPQPFRANNSGPPPQAPPQTHQAPPPVANEGVARVAVVSAAVADLRQRVAEFPGADSRTDKTYLLLDELLTRRLLELDDVDPAGRDDVRSARKQAIRDVQDCISQLEAKVPLPAAECPPGDGQSDAAEEEMPAEMPAKEMPAEEMPASQVPAS